MSTRLDRQSAAEKLLGEHVVLEAVVDLPAGTIEAWRGAEWRPARLLPLFVGDDRSYFRTDESWSSFELMLMRGMVDLDDTALLTRLIAVAPGRRSAVCDEYRVPTEFKNTSWAPHRRLDGTWVAHLIDHDEGQWERIEISPGREVRVSVLGAAAAFPFR